MFSKKYIVGAVATALMLTLAPTTMAANNTTATPAVAKVDLKSSADAYLSKNAAKYNLKSDLSDLALDEVIETAAGSYVRYQQTVEGAPMFYNQVTVTLDKAGNAILVTSGYETYTSVEPVGKKISETVAEDKAKNHNDVTTLEAPSSRKFGYTVIDGVAVPTYKVIVHGKGGSSIESYVHAGSGKVLKSKDINHNVNGTGKVFLPTPIETAGTKTGFADNNDANFAAATAQLKTVTLQGLDGSGYLTGSYVKAVNKKANTYSSTFTYNFDRNADDFENVMVYHHIDTLQRYIQSLGFTNINNRQIVVNVNGTTQDNSFYSPSTKQLTFGTGGVDDAEDTGIIAHEYGHSIQDNQVPGFGNTNEGGAMGEAFGDFLGATYEDALTNNDAWGKACIGEWDAISYSSSNPPCLRRLDENKVYPTDIVGQVHTDGEIWSQGEYEMAQAFGRDVATKLILQSHFSLTPNSGFANGVAAIKAADQLLYGGSHLSQITAIWNARGL